MIDDVIESIKVAKGNIDETFSKWYEEILKLAEMLDLLQVFLGKPVFKGTGIILLVIALRSITREP